MNIKNRSKSSGRWLAKHFRDPYVKERNRRNLLSRSWFKIEEIDKHNNIFKIGMNVINLGASPGGWTEYLYKKVGLSGRIIACDILPMFYLKNVIFIQGDITKKIVLQNILSVSKNYIWNAIISDMSPNMSGFSIIDQNKIFFLSDIALSIVNSLLTKNGYFIVKLFQGEGFNQYLKKIYSEFINVKIFKPFSSRINSREVFVIAYGRKM